MYQEQSISLFSGEKMLISAELMGCPGVEIMPGCWNFHLVKQNVWLVKLQKHKKYLDVSDVLNNALIIFRKQGFKRF